VENPTDRAQTLAVEINGSETGQPARIEPRRTAVIRSRIPASATELGIRYTGHRQLVITETNFE
jgi:hypothetical protein